MHPDFTPEQQALREEIREYYKKLFTPDLRAALDAEWHEVGGPVFRQVMTYALQARQVAPITPASPWASWRGP